MSSNQNQHARVSPSKVASNSNNPNKTVFTNNKGFGSCVLLRFMLKKTKGATV